MKFSVERELLVQGLGRIQAVVEKRGTLPILANVLIRARPEELTLSATDLEVGVVSTLNAQIETPGEVTLGARVLYEIVRELEEPELTLHLDVGARVKIESGSANFSLLSISAEEYPGLPGADSTTFAEVDAKLLAELIDRTLFATSTDDTRYNLNGVYMENVEKGRVRCVATDGHRLALIERSPRSPVAFLETGIIVPRKALAEIRKLCEETEGSVEIGLDGGFLMVRRPDLLLTARLIDGEFVNYQQVLPQNPTIRIVLDRERLLHATRRVALVVHERSHGFGLVLTSGQIELRASNPDLGDARELIPVDYSGDRFETSLNARYVLDVRGSISSKELVIELIEEISPVQFRPADDPDQLSVIMPMRT